MATGQTNDLPGQSLVEGPMLIPSSSRGLYASASTFLPTNNLWVPPGIYLWLCLAHSRHVKSSM